MPTREALETKPRMKEIIVKTKQKSKWDDTHKSYKWWLAQTDEELCSQLLSTTNFLKKANQQRIRQASIYTRLLSGKPLYNYLANVSTLDNSQQLPIGRPTANVCYACTDTLVSRITENKPKPTFLTDKAHYKEDKLARELNNFMLGEFYREKAYDRGAEVLRDACAIGDGLIKVFPRDKKVRLERTLVTELLTDYNDAYYGNPKSLIQMKLVDRGAALGMFPEEGDMLLKAQHGNVDNTPLSTETVSDQFIVSEGWHISSGEGMNDGRHVIVCSAGVLLDEAWSKPTFPFVKLGYNPNIVGWYSQSLVEILMPTQMEIYKMLIIASQAIELMGVPRIYIDELSKIVETAFNNNIGTIIKGRGAPPQFLNATSNAPEIYEWIKWLIENAYQTSGISPMAAASQKPAGLNSGEAQRVFLNTQDARFSALERRYQNIYTDLSYLMIDCARDIAKEEGSYITVYPARDGTREVDLPKAAILRDTYVIRCEEESYLPEDPAGRQAKLSEQFAAGEISLMTFRRLSRNPDTAQADSLAVALEERILHDLDAIIEDGAKGYNPPDPFVLDPTDLATTLSVNYINKYIVTDVEESKMQLLRDYFTAVQVLKGQAMPPPVPAAPMPGQGPGQGQLPVQPPAPSISPTSNVQV